MTIFDDFAEQLKPSSPVKTMRANQSARQGEAVHVTGDDGVTRRYIAATAINSGTVQLVGTCVFDPRAPRVDHVRVNEYARHRPLGKPAGGSKIKILYSNSGNYFVGGFKAEPVQLSSYLRQFPDPDNQFLNQFANLGGSDYLISGYSIRFSTPNRGTLRVIGTTQNWEYTWIGSSINATPVPKPDYGAATWLDISFDGNTFTFYSVFNGAVVATRVGTVTAGVIDNYYSYAFPGIPVSYAGSVGFPASGAQVNRCNSDYTLAIGRIYPSNQNVSFTPTNLAGTPIASGLINGGDFIGNTFYSLPANSNSVWTTGDSVTVTKQSTTETTSSTFTEAFFKVPSGSTVLGVSYHPD